MDDDAIGAAVRFAIIGAVVVTAIALAFDLVAAFVDTHPIFDAVGVVVLLALCVGGYRLIRWQRARNRV